MIGFEKFTLPNGLEVVIHSDHSAPLVCLNVLYKVGSRNEHPDKTGFAHLFEHLMFGGSQNIASFDEPLQQVGGENNAFTNADYTNYYITLPSPNAETAFWLESDRMLSLSFDPQVLEVQRSVVIEEFRQRYLNQPYGDVWLKLRPVAYERHPYRWPTIGKEISHIEQATMEDVVGFFDQYYHPANAILVVSGDISREKARALTEKWFGPIPGKNRIIAPIPQEPMQTEKRVLHIRGEVPQNALYKVFHMPGRMDNRYYATDLLSDLLGRGNSSYLHQRLVKGKEIFSSLSSYVTGNMDPGLLVVSGKLNPGISLETAEMELNRAMEGFGESQIQSDLDKVKIMAESSMVFSEMELLNRAMNLAFATYLGNTNLVNEEKQNVLAVRAEEILDLKQNLMVPQNSTTLYYETIH